MQLECSVPKSGVGEGVIAKSGWREGLKKMSEMADSTSRVCRMTKSRLWGVDVHVHGGRGLHDQTTAEAVGAGRVMADGGQWWSSPG